MRRNITFQALDTFSDDDARGGMCCHDENDASPGSACLDQPLHFWCDVDHLHIFPGDDLNPVELDDHACSPSRISALTRKISSRHSSENPSVRIAFAMLLLSTRGLL